MLYDLFFNEVERKQIGVQPKEGSGGSTYKIAVRDGKVRPGGDEVVTTDGQKYIKGQVSPGNEDKYTITGEPEVVEGDPKIRTQKVVETKTEVAWGIFGVLFAALLALGVTYN